MWQNYFYNLKAPKWLVLLLCFRVLLACCGYVKDTAVCADLLRAGEAWHEAVLVKVSHPAESSTMYVLRLQSGVKVQIFQNSAASARPAYLANSYDAADELFLPGDKLSVKLRLSEPQPPRNPGNFNEQWHFFTQDIQLKADLLQYARGDAAGSETSWMYLPQRWSYGLRERLSLRLLDTLGRTEGGLAAAMLLGNERYLDKQVERSFRKAGLAHVLVVSGGNVAIVMLLLGFIFEKILSDFRSRCVALMTAALFFGSVCAWDASVTRAVLMYVFSALALYFKRPGTPLRHLLYAAIFMFFIRERSILQIGYLMSAACSYSILRYAPSLQRRLEHFIFKRLLEPRKLTCPKLFRIATEALLGALSLTVSAQMAVFPFNVHLHSQVGPFQVLINLPISVLVAFSISLGCLLLPWLLISALPALWLSPGLVPLAASLRLSGTLAELGARAPLTFIADDYMLLLSLPVYLFLICAWLPRLRSRQIRLKIFYISAVLCLLSVGLLKWTEADYRISFIYVGQGSAILLHSKAGQSILYDCGPPNAAPLIASYCKSLGLEKLDLLIISHMHGDHYGSFDKLVQEVAIEAVLLPDDSNVDPDKSEEERAFIEALAHIRDLCREEGIAELQVLAGSELSLGGMRLNFLNTAREAGSLGNAGSYLVRAELNGQSVLLLGDMTREYWPLVNISLSGKIPCIVQFPHHGSRDGLPVDPKQLQAGAVVMQMAPSNRYGHPHATVLKSLQTLKLPYFRSDMDACIEVRVEGERWTLETYHNKRKLRLR